ncbi:hypothetical protein DRN69_09330 [Candidatus Pacearchaeota archaeon]|nr:MAG: hypothetical protein DRN69_09330 [Candidatus Pacearchaeota archaeon]
MRERREGKIIGILVVIIIVLLLLVVYSFVVRPVVNAYIIKKQLMGYNQGIQDMTNYMLNQIQQRGYTQIVIGNQTLSLVPYQPAQPQPQG